MYLESFKFVLDAKIAIGYLSNVFIAENRESYRNIIESGRKLARINIKVHKYIEFCTESDPIFIYYFYNGSSHFNNVFELIYHNISDNNMLIYTEIN